MAAPNKDKVTIVHGYPQLPLNPPKRQIRLLELHKGQWKSELQATLRVVSLGDHPDYDALSYTWGARTNDQPMTLNGRYHVKITNNLFEALRRLRQRLFEQPLWVDALCIDQDDDCERTQ